MELWVRSQDKLMLLKIDAFTISEDPNNKRGFGILDGYTVIGWYKSKERALEVLDDIEDKLINCTFAKKQNGLGEVLDFMPNSIYVYTMPKE